MSGETTQSDGLDHLQALTNAALSQLDLDALLHTLLTRSRDLLGADAAAVLLRDDVTDALVERATVGVGEEAQPVRVAQGDGLVGRVALDGEAATADDVEHAADPMVRRLRAASLLAVPLRFETRTVGVLVIGTLAPRRFDDADIKLVRRAAARAAVAIERARLYEGEHAARRRLEDVQAITDSALAHLEVDELLTVLLPRIRDILSTDTCAVLLRDDETDELVARAAVGIEEEVEQGVRIPIGRGFAGRIAAERRPVILDDVDHADVLNPLLRQKGIKSMAGVPLNSPGGPIGVLHVGSLVPRTFTPADIELLQLAADRAALAIEYARAFETERRARRRLEYVQAITDTALAHLEVDELLDKLLPRIRDILGADTCAVLLLDEDADELVARSALGIEEEVERGVRIPLGKGFAGRVAAYRRPVILDDVAHADVVNPILNEKGIKSMLGVPLLVRDRAIGVLHVGSLVFRRFTQDDTELLQLVADRVAVALERAHLHEETLRLDQLKLNFVAIASHELRTPATSVYGAFATLVERGSELSEELREQLLQVGYEQATRLRRLLDELLDLSRLDSHAIAVDPRPIVLHSALAQIVQQAVADDSTVQLHVPDDLAAVVDPLVLDRVVSNLLINAARYGAPPILVEAEQRDRHLRVTVEDAGAGVPDELQPRLFERFARGDAASGSGLGLAIARAYARAHGGDLIYNPGPSGARFELILPQQS